MPENVLVSFPRAGRTWLLTMVGLAYTHKHGVDDSKAVEYRKRVLNATHDKMDKGKKVHKDDISFNDKYRNSKVVFLVREPKDQMVSAYLHAKKNKRYGSVRQMSVSEYVRHPQHGIEKLIAFSNVWYKNRDKTKDFMVVWYEALKLDTLAMMMCISDFFEFDLSTSDLEYAVRKSSIEQLQKWEREGKIVPKPNDAADLETYYFRKGEIGDYVNYLSAEDIEFCNTCIKEMLFGS